MFPENNGCREEEKTKLKNAFEALSYIFFKKALKLMGDDVACSLPSHRMEWIITDKIWNLTNPQPDFPPTRL